LIKCVTLIARRGYLISEISRRFEGKMSRCVFVFCEALEKGFVTRLSPEQRLDLIYSTPLFRDQPCIFPSRTNRRGALNGN